MKFALLAVIILLSISVVSANLEDGKIYKLNSGNSKCVDVEIPDDFGVVDTLTDFLIKSNCGTWCDLSEAIVTTDFSNHIIVPVCITADGDIGDSKQFSISITDNLGNSKSYDYGVCVSKSEDEDSVSSIGEDVCGQADIKQDYFSLSINPETIYAPKNGEFEYEVKLLAQGRFDIEVESVTTGKKWNIQTEKGVWESRKQKISSPPRNDVLKVVAKIRDCKLPSCIKEAKAQIILGDGKASGDFSIDLQPETFSVKKGETITYSLNIVNYGDQKDYKIRVFLDNGLETDFQEQTLPVLTSRNVNFKVTAKDSGNLKVVVEAAGTSKSRTASISLNELVEDIKDAVDSERIPDKIKKDTIGWLERNKNEDIEDQVDSWNDLIEGEGEREYCGNNICESGENPKNCSKDCKEGDSNVSAGVDIVYIIIPIIIIVIILFYVFYRKRKSLDDYDEYQEERY